MSIMLSPLWPALHRHLVIETYARDGGHDRPRIRIEFRDLPPELAQAAADYLGRCVHCGKRMFPLRQREGSRPTDLYYAPTCPLDRTFACARSQAASEEYERFRHQRAADAAEQLRMF